MRKLNLIVALITLNVFLFSCSKEDGDKEKIVTMTIYPETGYGASVMSNIITEPLIFSESDNNEKRMMLDIITEGFDLNYERGYEYTLRVKKIWMSVPPQDVSSIKYEFIELLNKEKVITEDSEDTLELFVSAETIQFMPSHPLEFENGDVPKVYDALYVKDTDTEKWMALKAIEGFDYEEGYEYQLSVKKETQASPYSVNYKLLDIIAKQAAD